MSKVKSVYLKLIFLEYCPYSEKLKKFLDDMKIKYKLVKVTQSNKHKYISTFPQLYFITKK